MSRKRRRRYTAEEKQQALTLIEKVGNVSEVARQLGLNRSVLARWLSEAEKRENEAPGDSLTADERKEPLGAPLAGAAAALVLVEAALRRMV